MRLHALVSGNCGLRFSCAGGCRANAFSLTGSLTGCDLSYKKAYNWLEDNTYEKIKSFYDKKELDQKNINPRYDEHVVGPASEGYGPWTPPVTSAIKAYRRNNS